MCEWAVVTRHFHRIGRTGASLYQKYLVMQKKEATQAADGPAPWLGKTVRLSESKERDPTRVNPTRVGTVESSANGYYLVRLRDGGEVMGRGADLTEISAAEAEAEAANPRPREVPNSFAELHKIVLLKMCSSRGLVRELVLF